MKLYELGLAIVIAAIVISAYISGVYNWSQYCKPGGLDPPGCKPAAQTEPVTK